MELEPGFKLSEAGPIPKDWEAKTLGQLAANVRNAVVGGPFGSDLTAEDYCSDGVPVIRGSNLHKRVVQGPFVYVSAQKSKALEANLARPGDVVFTQRGTLGQVALVPYGEHEAYLVSQSQMKVTLDASLADGDFIVQVFSHPEFKRKVIASAIQTGVPHLNLAILRGYVIPRPAVDEQRAIARALNDIDAWIADAEREVSKLASIKAAAMDALLTPNTRLPGFMGEWDRVRIGDLYDPLSTVAVARGAYASGAGVACIHYGDIHVRYDGFVRIGHDHVATVPVTLAGSASRLKSGDVLIADAAEDLEGVGKAVELVAPNTFEIIGGLHVQALRPKSDRIAPGFAGYLFRQNAYREAVERAASGLKVFGISKSQLAALEVRLPPTVPEQRAIATVLSDIDAGLAAARAVVAKARGVKAAAMDALLSGRVRLPPFGPARRPSRSDALEAA